MKTIFLLGLLLMPVMSQAAEQDVATKFNAKLYVECGAGKGAVEILTPFYWDATPDLLNPLGGSVTPSCFEVYTNICGTQSTASRAQAAERLRCYPLDEKKTKPRPSPIGSPSYAPKEFPKVPAIATKRPSPTPAETPGFFEGMLTGAKFLGSMIMKYGDVLLRVAAIGALLALTALGTYLIVQSFGTGAFQSAAGTLIGISALFVLMVGTIFNKLDSDEKIQFLKIKKSIPLVSISQVNFTIDAQNDLMTINDMQIAIEHDGDIVKATVTKIGSEKSVFDFMDGAQIVLDRGTDHVTNNADGVCTSGRIDSNGKIISDDGC